LTDSAVALQKERIVESVSRLVSGDTWLIAPWTGDFHPDHEACGRAAQEVAERTGASLCWYFFWTWHRGTPASLRGLDLRVFNFHDSLLETKLNALACHQSQLHRKDGDPILPDHLLGPAKRNFEVFAPA
jgi:LmbE family N-acetylglucosaminyl deacetylase